MDVWAVIGCKVKVEKWAVNLIVDLIKAAGSLWSAMSHLNDIEHLGIEFVQPDE